MLTHSPYSAWMPNTDLQPLTPDACKDVPEKGKGKALLEAYKIAAEGYDLTHFKEILAEHQEQLAEDKQRQKEREAKKAAKSKRKSGASVAAGNDDEDEMDVDDEEVEEKPKSKKRKKAAETDGEDDEKVRAFIASFQAPSRVCLIYLVSFTSLACEDP